MRYGGLEVIAFTSLALSGCFTGMSNLKSRASFDFECPEEQLKLTEISSATYGVEGCGRRGTYVCKSGPASSCPDWVLNVDVK